MQFPPIEIIFNLHPPICKVCAIKLFYSRRLSCVLYHCSYSNLTLGSDTSCRELTKFPTCEKHTKKKKKNNHTHKTIFTWFDNLPTSMELQGFHYYQGRIQSTTCNYNIFSLSKTRQQHLKTLITKVGFAMS